MGGLQEPQQRTITITAPLGSKWMKHKHTCNDRMWQQVGCNNQQRNTWMVISTWKCSTSVSKWHELKYFECVNNDGLQLTLSIVEINYNPPFNWVAPHLAYNKNNWTTLKKCTSSFKGKIFTRIEKNNDNELASILYYGRVSCAAKSSQLPDGDA